MRERGSLSPALVPIVETTDLAQSRGFAGTRRLDSSPTENRLCGSAVGEKPV
jgi:hypothetical protein